MIFDPDCIHPVWTITHPDYGVYLGRRHHESYWTNLDTAGQPAAATFDSKPDAMDHAAGWTEATWLLPHLVYYPVPSGGPFDLAACGLPVGDMFENLKNQVAKDARMARYAGGPRHFNA